MKMVDEAGFATRCTAFYIAYLQAVGTWEICSVINVSITFGESLPNLCSNRIPTSKDNFHLFLVTNVGEGL